MTQLRTRVITAIIAAPLVMALIILYGRAGLSLFVLAVVLCGLRELKRMLKTASIDIYWLLIAFLSCAFTLFGTSIEIICLILLISVLAVLLRTLLVSQAPDRALTQAAFSILGVIYLPFLASFAVCLGAIGGPEPCNSLGLRLVLLLFVATWVCDIAAYFCGRRWGKHKALERISPNKTLEGFFAGIIFSVLISVLFCLAFVSELSIAQAAMLGLLLGVFGQLGDFCASLIKRAVGQKDTGGLLPGHGGILDRMDSFLFNAPVMYVFIMASLGKAL